MAIVLYNEPQGSIKNAYNNSIIEFGVDAGTPARALITLSGYTFEITPNKSKFYFNLKEIVTLLINPDNFKDSVTIPAPNIYLQPDPALYLEQGINIDVILSNGNTESTVLNYKYLKSVQQTLRPAFNDSDLLKVLLPSIDDVKHVTYFEGYPFDIPIFSNIARQVTVTNKRTTTNMVVNLSKGVNRLFLSNGENDNLGFESILPLYTGVNQLEISIDANTKFTVFVNRKPIDCGVYLKWFNRNGAWSYWRCKKSHIENEQNKAIDELNNDFYNLHENENGAVISGKESEREFVINTGLMSEHESRLVSEIFTSPKVYLYDNTNLQPFSTTDFKEVVIKGSTNTLKNTNYKKNEYTIKVEQPKQYLQTYAS